MKAKDFHKIIQDTNACDNSSMAESLKADNPDVFNKKEIICENKQQRFKKRLAIFAPLVTVACLACILIPSILLTRKTDTDSGNYYYCYASEYGFVYSEKTLKEISIETDNRILYFDWYDVGSDCVTSIYQMNNTNTIIGFSESIYNLETDDYIELHVSPSKYILDKFNGLIEGCTNEIIIDNTKVQYCTDGTSAFGIVTYNSYTYYLTLMYNTDTQRLCSLIDELLPD